MVIIPEGKLVAHSPGNDGTKAEIRIDLLDDFSQFLHVTLIGKIGECTLELDGIKLAGIVKQKLLDGAAVIIECPAKEC
jgi:hypothetical protein